MFQGATSRKTDTFSSPSAAPTKRGPSGHGRCREDEQQVLHVALQLRPGAVTSPTFDVNYDVPRGPGGVEFASADFDLTNPANFHYVGFFDRSYVAAGDDWQSRMDANLKTGFSFIPKDWSPGSGFTTRDAYQENGQRYCANDDGGNPGAPCLAWRPGLRSPSCRCTSMCSAAASAGRRHPVRRGHGWCRRTRASGAMWSSSAPSRASTPATRKGRVIFGSERADLRRVRAGTL